MCSDCLNRPGVHQSLRTSPVRCTNLRPLGHELVAHRRRLRLPRQAAAAALIARIEGDESTGLIVEVPHVFRIGVVFERSESYFG